MNTNKKYTVILSAWSADAANHINIINTDYLKKYLEYVLYLNIEEAKGCYKGGSEISFVIHTNQLHTVQHLVNYASAVFNQECVLVSNNAEANVSLHYQSKFTHRVECIGALFVPNKGDGENYTLLNGQAWSVAL